MRGRWFDSIEKTIPMYEELGRYEEATEHQRAADRIRRPAGVVDLDDVVAEVSGD